MSKIEKEIVKKQHFIPRFYLRKFSNYTGKKDQKNKIIVYNKNEKKQYETTVYDIACENFFYDFDNVDEEDKQIFESKFSEIESGTMSRKSTN